MSATGSSPPTVPHFSGEAMITFNFHVDYWTDDQRLAFQQVVAAFFDQYLGWNAVPAPRAGVANIEVVKIRMGVHVTRVNIHGIGGRCAHAILYRTPPQVISLPRTNFGCANKIPPKP